MNRELKAFLIYAYIYIFIYMLNSLLLWLFMKFNLPPLLGTFLQALIMISGLYFSYIKIISKYFGVEDRRRLTIGWLWQFVPFVLIAFFLLFFSFYLFKYPSLAIFIYLNLSLVALYFTFKYSLKKVVGEG
ncbi:hypothetical protein C7457_1009 [Thermovibrio guaymasensis]|uniref:Uncharacterized protein n=1 Tax=Thermovibrio guaymasensis TaxID=240167 RepID=A0A420W9Y7_9BACT|nr:hypothetical protein [Thermovibrio guaymasensis]RKQ64117.1 hypothetical protein C7457_1009 [Thermovibrio guaymasensis]